MRRRRFPIICCLLLLPWCAPALAQRIQIPNGTLVPQTAPTTGATLGQPTFDPYSVAPASQPSLFGQPAASPTNSYGVNPFGTSAPPAYGVPPATAPYTAAPAPYGAAPTGAPPFTGPSGNPFAAQPAQPPLPYGNPYGQHYQTAPPGQ
ncbi:MAG TPA: hypothetical protein VL096_03665, partial [Pirellulaceae bacterium]|nr:hypothetical protein [Pirellulaceae bacterium]